MRRKPYLLKTYLFSIIIFCFSGNSIPALAQEIPDCGAPDSDAPSDPEQRTEDDDEIEVIIGEEIIKAPTDDRERVDEARRALRELANDTADELASNEGEIRRIIDTAFLRLSGEVPNNDQWDRAIEVLRNSRMPLSFGALDPDAEARTVTILTSNEKTVPVIQYPFDTWYFSSAGTRRNVLIHEFIHALSKITFFARYSEDENGDGVYGDADHVLIDEVFEEAHAQGILSSCFENDTRLTSRWPPRKTGPASSAPIRVASSFGDPHIRTLDGFAYPFQTVGEYIFARKEDGLEIQTRQQARNESVTFNTAVAFRAGNKRVVVYARDFPGVRTSRSNLWVDGSPKRIRSGGSNVGNATIEKRASGTYNVTFSTGEALDIRPRQIDGFDFLDIRFKSSPTDPGNYEGLVGDRDGNPDNDLQTREGDVVNESVNPYGSWMRQINSRIDLPIPIDRLTLGFFDRLHEQFGESWRLNQEESLFDYGEGETTESYTDRSYPARYRTLASFPPAVLRDAQRECRNAGVPIDFMQGCVYDIAMTGNQDFANIAFARATERVKDQVEQEVRGRAEREIRRRVPF
ncbi:MAG: VWD domain-containing protein [Pseudomonadota bacterium]